MNYPSEILRQAAYKAEAAEDWVLDRNWRFWRYAELPRDLERDLEQAERERDALLADYVALREWARSRAGKLPLASAETQRLLARKKWADIKSTVARVSKLKAGG